MKHLLSREEYEQWVKELPENQCPFCNIQEQILLGTSEHWYWIGNISPYWRYHTLLIPKQHKEGVADLSLAEFADFQKFYLAIVSHLVSLDLDHTDGKPVDQFILMIRTREEGVEKGSTYPKPRHLHIHIGPDREGVERFVLDPAAVQEDLSRLLLPEA